MHFPTGHCAGFNKIPLSIFTTLSDGRAHTDEMMTLLVSQNTSMGFVGTFAVAGIEQMDDIEGTE